jgi:hypothetical protein
MVMQMANSHCAKVFQVMPGQNGIRAVSVIA